MTSNMAVRIAQRGHGSGAYSMSARGHTSRKQGAKPKKKTPQIRGAGGTNLVPMSIGRI